MQWIEVQLLTLQKKVKYDDVLSLPDIDECIRYSDQCEETCINVMGNHRCGCQDDLVLAADQTSCNGK